MADRVSKTKRSSSSPVVPAILPESRATRKLCPGTDFQRRGPEVGFGEVSATDCRSLPKYFLEARFWIVSG